MNPVEDLYDKRFFRSRHRLNWRAPYVCGGIIETFGLKRGDSVIDIGCGIGDLVAEFISLGYKAQGVEGSKYSLGFAVPPPGAIMVHDMRKEIDVDMFNVPYKLLTCFEVAEHLEEEYANTFVFNLCILSDTIVMSAAPPGQGGIGHVNCQPLEYWEKKFSTFNYGYSAHYTNALRSYWTPWRKKPGIKAFFENLMIFKKKG